MQNAPPSPMEDPDRQPDGFPHRDMAKLVLVAAALAVVIFAAWTTDRHALAIVTAATIPFIIIALQHGADSHRDHLHPSR